MNIYEEVTRLKGEVSKSLTGSSLFDPEALAELIFQKKSDISLVKAD